MKYTKQAAQKLATQIRARLGQKIVRAAQGSDVPPSFLVGLVAVESGGRENASRFEPHVFAKLKQVRDGKLLQYNKIRTAQLKDASDAALKNLASSFGATQIMGYWSLALGISLADLRNPEKHLGYAVRLLNLVAPQYIERADWPSVLRIWNTGTASKK